MKESHIYPQLVRKALEFYFSNARKPKSLDELGVVDSFGPSHGVFVSLHKDGDLRGCIGTIMASQKTLGDEIIQNTFSAAFNDPRFPPLEAEELPLLEINVDVLSEFEESTRDKLDPKKYGVMVSTGWKRGLLLPDLEGVDTVDMQLSIACRKGGIGLHEKYVIERFTVERYK
ncbi:MAG: AmmeMemoRadiSam system protein A [Spirochaetaceae bacterium]|nr:AmmeMemoRadiSam system protein A [Spirochaetaceae bacterium]